MASNDGRFTLPRNPAQRTAGLVLVSGLLLTGVSTYLFSYAVQAKDLERFQAASTSLGYRVRDQLNTCVALLRSSAGLFAVESGDVTRQEFHDFVSGMDLRSSYPGILGIGVSLRVDPADRAGLVERMVAQGIEDFHVWPGATSEELHATVYLEPLSELNRKAIGYNMHSDETHREAMDRARDSGRPAASGRVKLVQEAAEPRQQAGFLIYVPVYRAGRTPETVDERRRELLGFVYSPFRADDFFEGIIAHEARPRVLPVVYDGEKQEPAARLYPSRAEDLAPAGYRPRLESSAAFDAVGRRWSLQVRTSPNFERASGRWMVLPFLVAGIAISLALFVSTLSEGRARVRAEVAARELARSQRELSEQARVLEIQNRIGIALSAELDPDRLMNSVTEAARELTGASYGAFRAEGGLRSDDDTRDPRYGHDPPFRGMPEGHLAVKSYLAVPVVSRSGEVLGGIFLGHPEPGVFEDRHERLVAGIAAQAAVALDNARLYQAMLESEERYRFLADFVPQIVWTADPEGAIDYYNRRWFEFTGLTQEVSCPSGGLRQALHPEDAERCIAGWAEAVRAGQPFESEVRLRRAADGEWRWHLARALPMRGRSGAIVRWFGTYTDIDDQKRAAEELSRHARELASTNAELEQFAYVASHDLQEPLRMVVSYTQLLARRYRGRLDPKADEFIEFAVDGATRMQRLIRDLLAYSRAGSSARPLLPTDSGRALQEALANLRLAVAESGAEVTHGAMPTVPADLPQLTQVFQNLLANAIKFCRGTAPCVHIEAALSGAQWIFSVRDNGIGIEPEYHERIFQMFQRLNSREDFPGSGIGLAICRKIVERHGGRIWFESQPGEGSTFSFSIPAAAPRAGG
ncbi:MAG TPA: CHASE domain-containing protein [Planctomycetota bacterium]|nr:CHASE domain-containing protein [Planctomycetota bacterium]